MKRIFHSFIFKFILITLIFFFVTSPIVVLFGPFGRGDHAFSPSPVYYLALFPG